MADHSVEEHLAVWADVVSFLLLCIAILIQGGIDPRRTVWGRSPIRNAFIILFMSLNIIFSIARFIAEGVLVETGPREFLLISVIYSARWLWLFAAITKSDSRAARAFSVARELRKLKTIRFGTSSNRARKGRGRKELVIRRGARVVSGNTYWRGVEEYVKYNEPKSTYKVRLVEKELHAGQLDEIGTVDFKRRLETESSDALYRKIYDLVMTVDNNQLDVDYSAFNAMYEPVRAVTSRLAQRVGATDESGIGNVARRVAADACYYIWKPGAELRTAKQVSLINQCVESCASRFLGVTDMGADSVGRKDRRKSSREDNGNDYV
ncbi:hypothetical protein FGB62_45g136 [Gracilaria domingensis]|nr:hypothetical protein FGB62_45g136 [Gracilaria domingensis]